MLASTSAASSAAASGLDPSTPLPAGLTDPLHLPKPTEPWVWALVVSLALLLAFALLLWWIYRRSLKPQPEASRPPEIHVPVATSTIGDQIQALADEYTPDPRLGCHRLAALLREHLGQQRRQPFAHLTAREISQHLSGQYSSDRWPRLLTHLASLRFGRSEPTLRQFRSLCHDAHWLVEGRRQSLEARQSDSDTEPAP